MYSLANSGTVLAPSSEGNYLLPQMQVNAEMATPSKCFGSPGSYDKTLTAAASEIQRRSRVTSARARYAAWNADRKVHEK
jgi:hypothetical protein